MRQDWPGPLILFSKGGLKSNTTCGDGILADLLSDRLGEGISDSPSGCLSPTILRSENLNDDFYRNLHRACYTVQERQD